MPQSRNQRRYGAIERLERALNNPLESEPEPSERYEDLDNGVTRVNLTQAERRGLRAPNVREIGDD